MFFCAGGCACGDDDDDGDDGGDDDDGDNSFWNSLRSRAERADAANMLSGTGILGGSVTQLTHSAVMYSITDAVKHHVRDLHSSWHAPRGQLLSRRRCPLVSGVESLRAPGQQRQHLGLSLSAHA